MLEDGTLNFDNTLDISSLYGMMMFATTNINDDQIQKTVSLIESILLDKSPSGGSPRYEHDHYFESDPPFMGNPWFVTTLWMAQYYIKLKDMDKAKYYVRWTLERALPSGVLSEQINPSDNKIISVTPLVWSHAELINTVLDLTTENTKKI
jgi:GH15 family glucan-1,4-alpha-glucosidase